MSPEVSGVRRATSDGPAVGQQAQTLSGCSSTRGSDTSLHVLRSMKNTGRTSGGSRAKSCARLFGCFVNPTQRSGCNEAMSLNQTRAPQSSNKLGFALRGAESHQTDPWRVWLLQCGEEKKKEIKKEKENRKENCFYIQAIKSPYKQDT